MDMKVCPFLSWLGYLTIFSVFSHQPEQYDPLYGSNSNIGGSQYGKGGDGEKNLLCCKNFSSYSKILMIPLFSPHWLWFNEIIKFLASEVVNSNSSGAWPVMACAHWAGRHADLHHVRSVCRGQSQFSSAACCHTATTIWEVFLKSRLKFYVDF